MYYHEFIVECILTLSGPNGGRVTNLSLSRVTPILFFVAHYKSSDRSNFNRGKQIQLTMLYHLASESDSKFDRDEKILVKLTNTKF